MFNLNKFNAMLLNHNVSKEQLARYLDISLSYLYRKIRNGGDFTIEEIRQLISFFSKEEVFGCLFDYE